MSQLTHKYINRIPEREENLFLEEYYSGTDTKVYISSQNNPETEIAYISYSVSEQLKPLYGYASRTWDDVAVGNRIVTGAFKISIKNPEVQSTFDEVKGTLQHIDETNKAMIKSTLEQIDEMNKTEEETKQELEWIDDGSGETSGGGGGNSSNDKEEDSSNNYEDPIDGEQDFIEPDEPENVFSQEVQDYQKKLQLLGYAIEVADGLVDSDGNCIGATREALILFCQTYMIPKAYNFNSAIKNAIDDAMQYKDSQILEVYGSTEIYAGPGKSYGIIATTVGSMYLLWTTVTEDATWFKVKTIPEGFSGWVSPVSYNIVEK